MADTYRTLPIGTIFTYKGNKYQVCEHKDNSFISCCRNCAFCSTTCNKDIKSIRGYCSPGDRTDNANVYFKLIKNNKEMNENKNNYYIPTFKDNDSLNDLFIKCPKGYSIDLDNSDSFVGVIKFKKDNITLGDIYENQGRDTFVTNIVVNNKNTYNKILAIAQLMDIANYYNKGWKPDWNNREENKYYIRLCKNTNENDYDIGYRFEINHGIIFFKNKEDAQAVIDNPEFRDILDAIYKN